ncbi:transcriptional regulator [Massilia glaciei]|uniref:Transcriptional regulator n=1 Tax=Massilia glaciei TaxID=1524097 RepID=A0A2U2I6M2_9BURK|nr:transcriptional regulator [Massilia glaciei]PWF55392.1 transcriptional regulator [Massilia glaciei]
MLTVVETQRFMRMAETFWNELDLLEFVDFIAASPDAGAVAPGSGGLRKIRWGHKGRGKRGGVRVIYYNRLNSGEVWLLLVYDKTVQENIPSHVLRKIKGEIENG